MNTSPKLFIPYLKHDQKMNFPIILTQEDLETCPSIAQMQNLVLLGPVYVARRI